MADSSKLSHLNESGNPRMVDVSEKRVSKRMARAQSQVVLPPEVLALLLDGDIQTKKGAVFQTAIIAGIMGAKKTHELIPMCHPLGLDKCSVDIRLNEEKVVIIDCTAQIEAKTGVEMEALTGASVAALTIYDMCKGISQDIRIRETRLMAKSGGKTDFQRDA